MRTYGSSARGLNVIKTYALAAKLVRTHAHPHTPARTCVRVMGCAFTGEIREKGLKGLEMSSHCSLPSPLPRRRRLLAKSRAGRPQSFLLVLPNQFSRTTDTSGAAATAREQKTVLRTPTHTHTRNRTRGFWGVETLYEAYHHHE